MGQAVQQARYDAVTKQTVIASHVFNGGWYQLIPFLIVAIVFVGGTTYFRKQSKFFAENI